MADSFNDLVEGIKLELEADFQNLVANSGGSRTDLINTFSSVVDDSSTLNSVGVYGQITLEPGKFQIPGVANVSGGGISVTVSLIGDVDNPGNNKYYLTVGPEIGPSVGFKASTPFSVGVVGYQGEYDDYGGAFFGVTGKAGVSGVSVAKSYDFLDPFNLSGDVAVAVEAHSLELEVRANATWTFDLEPEQAQTDFVFSGGEVTNADLANLFSQGARTITVVYTKEDGSQTVDHMDIRRYQDGAFRDGIITAARTLKSYDSEGNLITGPGIDPTSLLIWNKENGSDTWSLIAEDSCFGPEVPIDMWPLDPSLKLGPDGIYDQDEVRAKIWKKPIELIAVGDIVVSFDDNDNLVPGPVTRTFQNNAKILLDFHGTRVTPGHVYYRPDSKKSYKYETLIDVLRDDGVIKHQDGTLIRAATNVPIDSPRDGFVRAAAGRRKADGTFEQTDEGRIRLGTRFLVGDGEERKSYAVADLIAHNGGVVGDDELIHAGDNPGVPFIWDFADTLPKPEDFVLSCSGTTLEDIYKAAEWESQGPRLPAPMVLDRGPVQPLKGAALSAMPRNEPLNVAHSPMASAKPRRTLNRKQRKALEAKQRKAAKSHKRFAV